MKNLIRNHLFLGMLIFCVLLMAFGLYNAHRVTNQPSVKFYTVETPKEKSTAKVHVGDTSHGGHWHESVWHAEPHSTTVSQQNPKLQISRTELQNMSGVIHPLSQKTVLAMDAQHSELAVKLEEYASQQGKTSPHPHDELSPREHQQVHVELKVSLSKLDDLNRRLQKNSTALRAGDIEPTDSQTFLERASQELELIKANIKKLRGE